MSQAISKLDSLPNSSSVEYNSICYEGALKYIIDVLNKLLDDFHLLIEFQEGVNGLLRNNLSHKNS